MAIGAFARRGGVSVKTLRFYASEGLLEPAHVDADTSYRYYTADQHTTLTRILSLRALGMGVPEIRRALGVADVELSRALDRHEAALHRARGEIDEQLRALAIFRDALPQDWLFRFGPVRVVVAEPQLCLRAPVLPGAQVSAVFDGLERAAAEARARAARPPFTRWQRDESGVSRIVDVCIPVEDAASGSFSSEDLDWMGPRGVALSLVHVGTYAELAERGEALRGALETSGLVLGPESFEIYHRFGADREGYELPPKVLAPRSEEFVTELQIPILSDDEEI